MFEDLNWKYVQAGGGSHRDLPGTALHPEPHLPRSNFRLDNQARSSASGERRSVLLYLYFVYAIIGTGAAADAKPR